MVTVTSFTERPEGSSPATAAGDVLGELPTEPETFRKGVV